MSRNIVELRRRVGLGPHAWEAVIFLPRGIGWKEYVNGCETESGPWVGALGQTAEEAYQKALQDVGRAVVALSEHTDKAQTTE